MKRKSTFIKLILSAVLTGVSALANGQTVAEYNKANELIKDGQQYRIYSMVDGTKYYFVESETTDDGAKGIILGDRANACVFTFTQNNIGAYKIGDDTCEKGWFIYHTDKGTTTTGRFTNPKNSTTATNYLRRNNKTRKNESDYAWETQLWFAQETSEGSGEYKYAVRSTAVAGTSTWGSHAFWCTFTPDGAELPTAGYDLSSTIGTATYYDFYLEEVDYTQLFGNEEVTKGIFADANASLSECPWCFFKSRPTGGTGENGYTDDCSYDAENFKYYNTTSGWTVHQSPNGEFFARKPSSVFYSIASRYQNLADAEQWYKVENKVTAKSTTKQPVYMRYYYTASTATSGNLLNKVKPFHSVYAGKAVADRAFYIKMAKGSSIYFVPEGSSWGDTEGTIDYIKINAVNEADIPAGALCYNGSALNYELNVTSAGYATLVLPYAANCPEGVTLYQLNSADSNGYIQCTEQESLTANEPVLVKAAEGKYTFTATAAGNDASTEMTSGMLTGTYDRVQMTTGNYLLQNHNGTVGFYKVGETIKPYVGAFRAYMKSGVSEARELTFGDGEETGIENIAMPFDELRTGSVTDVQPMFNLQGQRVDASYRGVVIMNGKKVINK